MKNILPSIRPLFANQKFSMLFYFIAIILAGTLTLLFPIMWKGDHPISFIDALFTTTSAVCVTGLSVVDITQFTFWGQLVILILIQFGGLGIVSFVTLYAVIPRKISLLSRGLVQSYWIEEVDSNPRVIILNILFVTAIIEGIGAIILYSQFKCLPHAHFIAVFHAVSAFCNAGFSTFANQLEGYTSSVVVNLTVTFLIILGGLGFLVYRDIGKVWTGGKYRLSTHSKVVISTTLALIIFPYFLYLLLEMHHAYKDFPWPTKLLAAFFQTITPRTAGFDTVPQNELSNGSTFLSILLMFIGASPSSTGGGIKTTTFFILVLAAFNTMDQQGNIRTRHRSLPPSIIIRCFSIFAKAALLILVAGFVILWLERDHISPQLINITTVFYETTSAFGTVGLSLGITSSLSSTSKLILIFVMFMGRVGFFVATMPSSREKFDSGISYPKTTVSIG